MLSSFHRGIAVLLLHTPIPLLVQSNTLETFIIVQPIDTTVKKEMNAAVTKVDLILVIIAIQILLITVASLFEILALILLTGLVAIGLIVVALFLVEL